MNWSYIPEDKDSSLVHYVTKTQIEDHCTWQSHTLDYILSFYNKKTFRRCIDAGANYGFMSVGFAKFFQKVEAFEISPLTRKHLEKNIQSFDNIESHPIGLYNEKTQVKFTQLEGSGTSRISDTKTSIYVDVNPLDSFNFQDVDLIKIDVENSEKELIEGALNTIKQNLPVLVIEMNFSRADMYFGKRQYIFNYLYSLGYYVADIRHNDVIFLVK